MPKLKEKTVFMWLWFFFSLTVEKNYLISWKDSELLAQDLRCITQALGKTSQLSFPGTLDCLNCGVLTCHVGLIHCRPDERFQQVLNLCRTMRWGQIDLRITKSCQSQRIEPFLCDFGFLVVWQSKRIKISCSNLSLVNGLRYLVQTLGKHHHWASDAN